MDIILIAMLVRLFIKAFTRGTCLVESTNLPSFVQRKGRNQNFWPNLQLVESELLKIRGKQSSRYLEVTGWFEFKLLVQLIMAFCTVFFFLMICYFNIRCIFSILIVWLNQVNQLVAQLFQMRVRMKNLMGVMEGGSVPALSNLQEALKSEQKVPLFFSFLLHLHVYG